MKWPPPWVAKLPTTFTFWSESAVVPQPMENAPPEGPACVATLNRQIRDVPITSVITPVTVNTRSPPRACRIVLPAPAPIRLTGLFSVTPVIYTPAAMLITSPFAEPSMQTLQHGVAGECAGIIARHIGHGGLRPRQSIHTEAERAQRNRNQKRNDARFARRNAGQTMGLSPLPRSVGLEPIGPWQFVD